MAGAEHFANGMKVCADQLTSLNFPRDHSSPQTNALTSTRSTSGVGRWWLEDFCGTGLVLAAVLPSFDSFVRSYNRVEQSFVAAPFHLRCTLSYRSRVWSITTSY